MTGIQQWSSLTEHASQPLELCEFSPFLLQVQQRRSEVTSFSFVLARCTKRLIPTIDWYNKNIEGNCVEHWVKTFSMFYYCHYVFPYRSSVINILTRLKCSRSLSDRIKFSDAFMQKTIDTHLEWKLIHFLLLSAKIATRKFSFRLMKALHWLFTQRKRIFFL